MMDVKTLCLGTLMTGEASGYDIKKMLEEGSSAGLVDASFGSIYPALTRLAADGLVTVRGVAEGRTDKKVYAITDAGRAHLLQQVSGPIGEEKFRSPFMFALLFAELMPRERLTALIDSQLASYEEKRRKIREFRDKSPNPGERFVLGYGLTMYEAALDYMRRERGPLEAAARDRAPAALRGDSRPLNPTNEYPSVAALAAGE
jgi:DNA-binding PadR family transcriptional regulator